MSASEPTDPTWREALRVMTLLRAHRELAEAFATPVSLLIDHPVPMRRPGAVTSPKGN